MLSKLDLAVIVVCLAGVLVGTERAHRIVIDAPVMARVAPRDPVNPCPDNDNVPYSRDCLLFLRDGSDAEARSRAPAVDRPARIVSDAPAQFASFAPAAPCSDSDNVPYTAGCLKFLSGWLWQANVAERPAATVLAH